MHRLGFALALTLAAPHVARADEQASSPARPGYEGSDHAIWWPGRAVMEERGLIVDGTYSVDMFLVPQLEREAWLGGLFTAELDYELPTRGALHISAFAMHGDGPTSELGDVHGVSGNTAPQDVRLFEAWVEQPIGPLTLRGGLLAADQEFVLADPSGTLISATFGITSQFSANVLGPVYPVAAPGVSGRLDLDPVLVQLAVYDGTLSNSHGIPTALGPEQLVIAEVTYADTLGIGAWHHSELGDALYATLDGSVDDNVAAFTRVGLSPHHSVPTYIDAGLRIQPGEWRPGDLITCGIAFARSEFGAQTLIEASYEAQIRWLSIQPDLQLILLHERTVGVVGLRTTIVF